MSQMFYCPVKYAGRHFSKTIEYTNIDFTKLSSIIPAFADRISDWYLTPTAVLAASGAHAI